MVTSRKENISFYKNRKKVGEIIIDHVKKRKYIVFGGRSLNAHFPRFLDKDTVDYDILIEKGKAKKVATRLEKKLDKRLGGDFYFVEPAKKPGTFRVKRRLGKEVIVDVSEAKGKVPSDKIKGVRYSKLSFEKQKVKESLADPASKFRHDKDRERLERINIFEALKKKRPKRKKKTFRSNLPKKIKARVNPGRALFPINFKLKTRPNF